MKPLLEILLFPRCLKNDLLENKQKSGVVNSRETNGKGKLDRRETHDTSRGDVWNRNGYR